MKTADEKVRGYILEQLEQDTTLDPSLVEVEVKEGKVRLLGSVPTHLARKSAEKDVLSVPGVTSVDNHLVVKPLLTSYPLPEAVDRSISDDIMAALSQTSAIDVSKIKVRVEKKVVTLTGTVPTWTMYLVAEDTARYTPGVARVKNELVVE